VFKRRTWWEMLGASWVVNGWWCCIIGV